MGVCASSGTRVLGKKVCGRTRPHGTNFHSNSHKSECCVQNSKSAQQDNSGIALQLESTAATDEEDWSWQRVVLDKYKVRGTDVLGIGNYSVVRRGISLHDGTAVAVKSLKQDNDKKFRREVYLFEELFQKFQERDEADLLSKIQKLQKSVTMLDAERSIFGCNLLKPEELLVRLLDHSPLDCFTKGQSCYCVQELGEFTLDELVIHCSDATRSGKTHSLSTETELLRALISILRALMCLHSRLLIHGDLKPANVMWFNATTAQPSGVWKLIDLDGLLTSSQFVDMRDADFYTPIYAAPEVAHAVATEGFLRVSRRQDIWAAGVTIFEMELLRPPLWSKFQEICAGNEGDTTHFMKWLSETPIPLPFPSVQRVASPELMEVLRYNMLVVDPTCRSSPVELLEQPILHSLMLQKSLTSTPPTLKESAPPVSKSKPKTAFQLFQEMHKVELEAQGLKGPKLLQEMVRCWKQLQQEGGEELDVLMKREAELRNDASS